MNFIIKAVLLYPVSFSEVLSPKTVVKSVFIGTPVAIVAGIVATVAFGVIGSSKLAYSVFDKNQREEGLVCLRLAGYGLALTIAGIVNPILAGAPLSYMTLSLRNGVRALFGEEDLPDDCESI
jgi:hypothetical protein